MQHRNPSPALPHFARRAARSAAAIALFASAGVLGGCACPSVGQITQVDLELDRAPTGDAVWELEVTVQGQPPCTYLIDADEVTSAEDDDGGDCRRLGFAYIRSQDPFVIGGVAEGELDGVGLTLTIDGVVANAGIFEPTYATTHPEGLFCPDDTDGIIRLQVPEV